MLNLLDLTLRQVLDTGWTTSPPPAKPGFFFTVPDEDWQSSVRTDTNVRVNLYLYEFRENRDFRRAEWDSIATTPTTAVLSRPPAYLDCHYLVSAWSPAEDSQATNPVLDEHQVLSEAMRVLLRTPTVTPQAMGIVGGGPVFEQAEVCLTVAPPETPRVLNDFWSTMRLPWRPAVQVVATAPIDLLQDTPPAPLLATLVRRSGSIGGTGVDERITLGGWVLLDADGTPVAGASVDRLDPTTSAILESTTTDAQGRFTLDGLQRGTVRLRATGAGHAPVQRDLNLPVTVPDDHVFRLI
ncbi:MAG TPA: Pvc16 family protein [Chloroflexota bacterium]|jgi:hypothetical protein